MTGVMPADINPSAAARPRVATCSGSPLIGAVADHVVRARLLHVDQRRAIDVDAERRQLGADQLVIEEHRLAPVARTLGRQRAELGRRGRGAPVRRLQALHPPALLVDQDRSLGMLDRRAQIVHQAAHLVRIGDVAREQDEAERLNVAEERALLARQDLT